MAYYNDSITYAGQAINVLSLNPIRIPAPYIQKTGKILSITSVPTDTMAWRLVINCRIIGNDTTLAAARSALQTAHDDKIEHAYVDGQHDGNYVCESLTWNDSGVGAAMKTNISFTMTLLEKKFSGGY